MANAGLYASLMQIVWDGVSEVKGSVDVVRGTTQLLGIKEALKEVYLLQRFGQQMNSSNGLQDREMIQSRLISLMAALHSQPDPRALFFLEKTVIQSLWDQLPHPPKGWASHCTAGPQFRRADGSENNPFFPNVGKAGSHYIRDVDTKNKNVREGKLIDGSPLPSPRLIFDKLFKRTIFKPHPCGLSSSIFHMATLVTHDIFNTDYSAPEKNKTTSYLDLGWLYGWNQEMQDSVRDKTKGKGLIYPDVLADPRLALQPPGLVALALLWARNHNYLAAHLCDHEPRAMPKTEGGEESEEEKEARDEWVFQTARAINIATYVYTIMHDYLRTFMGMNRTNSAWTLEPAKDFSPFEIPTATGNQCSIEFNFIYRWHSAISQKDEAWMNKLLEGLVGPDYTDPEVVKQKLTAFRPFLTKDGKKPYERTYFYHAARPASDTGDILPYPDSVLAQALKESIEEPAGAFGGLNVPAAMAGIEMMGIEQGRQLGVCTLNEYRKFLKLRQCKTFEEINPDPKICSALRELYKNVDDVELYPGLVAEEAQPYGPGVGLAAGHTIVTAIFSDAAALVRGDRFLTDEDTPANLTQWGYEESRAQADGASEKSNYGMIYGEKLLNRHLPGFFPEKWVGTVFPFNTPKEHSARMPKEVLHKYTLEEK